MAQNEQGNGNGIDPVVLDDIINRLLEFRQARTVRQVQLSENEIRQLCAASREIFLQQPNLLELEAPIKICGIFLFLIMFFLCLLSFSWFYANNYLVVFWMLMGGLFFVLLIFVVYRWNLLDIWLLILMFDQSYCPDCGEIGMTIEIVRVDSWLSKRDSFCRLAFSFGCSLVLFYDIQSAHIGY